MNKKIYTWIIWILFIMFVVYMIFLYQNRGNISSIMEINCSKQEKWKKVNRDNYIGDRRTEEKKLGLGFWEVEEYKINKDIIRPKKIKGRKIQECSFFFSDNDVYILDPNRYLTYLPNVDTGTFTFLYKEHFENMYGNPCYFKDKNYIYRDSEAIFSGFDYNTLHVLTGLLELSNKKDVVTSCLWGCFEDKDAVYYLGDSSNDTNLQWIRNIKKKFPKDASFDNVRNSIISNK